MNKELLERLKEECFIRNLSAKTCKIYEYHIDKYLEWADKPVEDLTLYDARSYILELKASGKSAWYCNNKNAAITFFYKRVLHRPWNYDIVPRMKLEWTLPKVLTRSEIEILVDTAKTTRNKAIIALMYSSGLRVGEIVRLAPGDIHMSTMQVHVRNGKNRGDHWTVLSDRALTLLKQYWHECPEDRATLFVSSRRPHRPLATGGVEIMLKKVGQEAGIDVHPHTLRHSFATHLIENDVSRECVQTMLGHRSPTSTAVYVHVTNKRIMGVTSPFDLPLEESNKPKTDSSKEKDNG